MKAAREQQEEIDAEEQEQDGHERVQVGGTARAIDSAWIPGVKAVVRYCCGYVAAIRTPLVLLTDQCWSSRRGAAAHSGQR